MTDGLLRRARRESGLTQCQMADRAGTSRTAISAYEHGRKSPNLETFDRLLDVAGFRISIDCKIDFREFVDSRGKPFFVASSLWRLPFDIALAEVDLPIHLNWSDVGRKFHLINRNDRARVYEIVLREGRNTDIQRFIDGLLLVEIWNELILPHEIREAWAKVISGH